MKLFAATVGKNQSETNVLLIWHLIGSRQQLLQMEARKVAQCPVALNASWSWLLHRRKKKQRSEKYLSERLATFVIIEAKFIEPIKPLNTMILWCKGCFRGPSMGPPRCLERSYISRTAPRDVFQFRAGHPSIQAHSSTWKIAPLILRAFVFRIIVFVRKNEMQFR